MSEHHIANNRRPKNVKTRFIMSETRFISKSSISGMNDLRMRKATEPNEIVHNNDSKKYSDFNNW
jgi:hypothetical protein